MVFFVSARSRARVPEVRNKMERLKSVRFIELLLAAK